MGVGVDEEKITFLLEREGRCPLGELLYPSGRFFYRCSDRIVLSQSFLRFSEGE